MKNTLFIVALGMIIVGCSGSKIIGYAYTEGGMMGSVKTTITADSLSFLKYSRGGKSYSAAVSDKIDWKVVHSTGKHVDYKNMDTLTAPSMGRATDAAPFANFEVITKDSTYVSASFDGGKPPATIEAIVRQMVRLSTKSNPKEE